MQPAPHVTTLDKVQKKSAHQAIAPVSRPSFADADLDMTRRPGVPQERDPPQPFPNTRFPPERQQGRPSAAKHGRPNKPMPPVFGTAVPPRGLSGAIRQLAYRYPDHYPRHWMLKLLGDRVESWGVRTRRFAAVALPLAAVVWVGKKLSGR